MVSEPTRTDLLIVGGSSDPNTFRIVEQAQRRRVDFIFWDTDLPEAKQIAWDFSSPAIDLGDHQFIPRSVYLRCNVFGGNPSSNHAIFQTIQGYVLAWPKIKILNRSRLTDANSKSGNLRLAIDMGFPVPQSLVMSDLSPITTMPIEPPRILKPLDGGAHTVDAINVREDQSWLAEAPPQFIQERLDGENVRIFSIGRQLFGFHLESNALDYREDDSTEVTAIPVPDEFTELIHRYVASLRFDYCALDFRGRDGLNELVFLEINSFPMFVRFDDAAEHSLADATISVLVGR
ncbi:MAG: hypothetical protein AAF664_07215 [Planctomycetota bacterium]